MTPRQAGRVLRAVRHRQALRLVDVATLAGSSASTVSRAESGNWDRLAYGRITSIASALDVRLDVLASWRGAELDRVLDEGHARLLGRVAKLVTDWGWTTRIEVTYSIFGERGSVDLLAWHPATRSLVVFEIKTELGSVETTLRTLNAKLRLAPRIAREQFGWTAVRVATIVVFPENTAVRRVVARHASVLDPSLPGRSREVRAWLRRPTGALRGRWFLSDSHTVRSTRNPSAIRRVRPRRQVAP